MGSFGPVDVGSALSQVASYLVDERLAELFGLPGADAVDGVQLLDALRLQTGQLAQGGVVEDDVRRDAAFARDAEADGAQPIEEIVIDVLPGLAIGPDPLRAPILRHAPLPGERQVGA